MGNVPVIKRIPLFKKKDQATSKVHQPQALEYFHQQNNIQLNIAITGESGSGKSAFVNAFRGIKNHAEGAAPTGCVETTMEIKSYPYPNDLNVTLWDLPGIGTTKFPARKYLKHVEFQKFDFFIIISADRFKENDVKLAQEIQKMRKKFYFVRSKIDNCFSDEQNQRDFNKETLLQQIRDNCIQGLQDAGVRSPQVFLVANLGLYQYDFPLLMETLEREIPDHKRDVLLLAIPNISLEIINKKKEAFKAHIRLMDTRIYPCCSNLPNPGASDAIDLTKLADAFSQCVRAFGLDITSLRRLAEVTGLQVEDLMTVITSPLAATEITTDLIKKLLPQVASTAGSTRAEEGLNVTTTYESLDGFINSLAKDAEKVLTKVQGLNLLV